MVVPFAELPKHQRAVGTLAARAGVCSSNCSKARILNEWHLKGTFIDALFWLFILGTFYKKEGECVHVPIILFGAWVM